MARLASPIRTFHCVISLAALATFSANAKAQDDADRARTPAIPQVDPNTPSGIFGAKGQVAISSDAGLYIENTSTSGDDEAPSSTTLQLRPAFDYFVIDNLSLGGFLGIDYSSVSDSHSTTWAIGPRIGYNIPVSPRFSIWPKLGFSFASTSQTIDADPPNDDLSVSSTNLALNAFVPVMFHPVEHFFLGFGPALDVDLTGDTKTTVIAGRLTIGGWL
jgi:hypothetical protein